MLKENTLITNFQPHFHLRGKAMQVEAILPDGSTQIISYVGNFNFNWMTNYIYADDAAPVFPKGTIIHVSACYDNTKANKNNPDPDQWVGYGDRTVDEMAHAWMNVVYLSDDEYKALARGAQGEDGEDARTTNETAAVTPSRLDEIRAPPAVASAGGRSCVGAVRQLPASRARQFGASITGAFEGWFDNADGSHKFLVGYLNRNRAAGGGHADRPEQPDRAGRPRLGQPTHFLPGRQTGACSSSPCRRSSRRSSD